MKCQVYIKDGRIFAGFPGSSLIFDEIEYSLGTGATDFSMFPEKLARDIFEPVREWFLHSVQDRQTNEVLFEELKEVVVHHSKMNVYFNFYLESYTMFLLGMRMQKPEMTDWLKRFMFVGTSINGLDFSDFDSTSQWAVETFIADMKKRQALLKEDLDAITADSGEFEGFNLMQRLYLISLQGRNYLSGEFKITLKPDYLPMPKDDMEKIKSTLLENKVDVVEMVEVKNLDDLLNFEMYHTLKANLLIRKCKHCGEYFVVMGRTDTEYCDRIPEEETKPCSIIGATRNYWDSKIGDPVYAEFQQAYKRNHSRRRVGKMTQNEFYEWSEEARKKRTECDAGLLTVDEYRAWLGNKR